MAKTVKFTVSVPGRVFKALEALRAKTGMSRSQLVREALHRLESVPGGPTAGEKGALAGIREEGVRYGNLPGPLRVITDPAERRRRALAAAGRFRSGLPDLSKDHDKYLEEAYAAGKAESGPGRKP